MDAPIQAVLFLGIIPALIFLYYALKGYEGYYKEKTIFLTFVIGIILGIIAAIIRLLIYPPFFSIIFIILFAFFEQLLKTIVLNIGRLQRKKETTIYGLSLGLGFGSSFTPFLIITMTAVSGQTSLSFLSLVVLGSLGFILFHSAAGAYIGYGITSGKMTRYLLISVALLLPFNALADLSRYYLDPLYPYFQGGLIIYGLIFFLFVNKKIMPQILEASKDKKRKKK